jgi:hypothetical protein
MIIQARFSAAQTGIGYQFYSAAGTLLGTRVTTGISALPETGSYIADATVPSGAVGVYWLTNQSAATEDLREALASGGGSSGDPLVATVPGDYAAGTAGYALGRLNISPPDVPVIVIPNPSDDDTLCVVYVDGATFAGAAAAGLQVRFTPQAGPSKTGHLLSHADVVMTLDSTGHGEITLHRNDMIDPDGSFYLVSCPELRLEAAQVTLTTTTFNLSDLITPTP